ncbi:peptide/nickel transport system substrate-binding protein [Bradyrhizobium shewense]|uniref:Peptide/nickel transport system substrate-binding protein n=1 Tax=Bradyrhizobium shewense TaxID=1761772 RepID=A0A1C3XUV2_9BRAD|nr:ABC transporter substrate-binding protein [Bradyrhizobium shewense]SCB55999.1 peptide/nickel transport system substrate-binding protein [Bradyrhizobium shewense]
MTISRRNLVKGGAAGAAFSVPSILRGQTAPSAKRTVKMQNGNITNFDPYSNSTYHTVDHGLAIYDMLFALDSKFTPQPQMVGKWRVSEDKKTYTFELRDGLGFHDGTSVTAADCVASIRRWGQTASGKLVMERTRDVSKKDDKTFTVALREPLELLVDQMASSTSYLLFIMREKDADRPPTQPVTTHIGSGPFKFNEALFRPGVRYIYDRNEKYVPRQESPSGLAGGKIVKVDRANWESLNDVQTALAALQAGELDFVSDPLAEFYPMIENDPNLVLEDLHKSGDNYYLGINFLQKPFDNVKARQALLHLVDQDAYMRVLNPNPKYNRPITSLFGTDTPYVNDVNTGWYKKGGDPEKAKQLLKEAGYAGEKVIILQPANWLQGSNVAQLLALTLRNIGVNTELAPSNWAALVERLSNKGGVESGGWSIFPTSAIDIGFGAPLSAEQLVMNGTARGWRKNDEYEALRAQWADSALEERKVLARKMQSLWWDTVGFVFLGQTITPIARRKTLTGLISYPALLPMWNMQQGA